MDASTRLYARLGEIPEDSSSPESLDDLLVCAFGAFERYYLCWKTRGGDYRQDGYNLPPALKNWLYTADSPRDFDSLQVVFGRGEEYFASDKYGKIEYKEPEAKTLTEDEERSEKLALRRSRTVSFLRPWSEPNTRFDCTTPVVSASRRTLSLTSERLSRPPSLSYSRTNSDASIISQPTEESEEASFYRSESPAILASQGVALDSCDNDFKKKTNSPQISHRMPAVRSDINLKRESTITTSRTNPSFMAPMRVASQQNTLDISPRQRVPSAEQTYSQSMFRSNSPSQNTSLCTCGFHKSSMKSNAFPTYSDASVQTDLRSVSPQPALPVGTHVSSDLPMNLDQGILSHENKVPVSLESSSVNPVFMGRMMDYFSMPGYQLGDCLMSGYHLSKSFNYDYKDKFGNETLL
ncbi:hypothetical protein BKA66DRAFT_476262 [Pyrenochaeta sp. MPI-SDFR-AT-0127]|nr:hypothetical protein BKA66DRAFT_476262 [Pyrenochaeta sp. MPI-SDFR-AT-0127]